MLKFLAVLAKVAITLLPASILPYQKRVGGIKYSVSISNIIQDPDIPLDSAKTNICSGQALPLLGGHLPTSSPAGAFAGVDMFAKNTQHSGNIEILK